VYRSDVGVGRTPPGGGGEAGKELLFGGIPGGARSGLPKSVGAGAPGAEDGRAVGGGGTPPKGAGKQLRACLACPGDPVGVLVGVHVH
jgi:hypothetical protein